MKTAFSTVATILFVGWAAVTHADAPVATSGLGQGGSQPAAALAQIPLAHVGGAPRTYGSQGVFDSLTSGGIALNATPAIASAHDEAVSPEPACILLLTVGSFLFVRRS